LGSETSNVRETTSCAVEVSSRRECDTRLEVTIESIGLVGRGGSDPRETTTGGVVSLRKADGFFRTSRRAVLVVTSRRRVREVSNTVR